MKIFSLLLIILSVKSFAQPKFQPTEKYMYLVARGYNLYNEKNYQASGLAFDSAFNSAKGLGVRRDFYHAAGSWALANNADKAFAYLNKVTLVYKYSEVSDIEASTDFQAIHQDKRWSQIIQQVTNNTIEKEAKWNKEVVAILDIIRHDDQAPRILIDSVGRKFGWNSKQLSDLQEKLAEKNMDLINLEKVKNIIYKYGWLGPKVIGDEGASTIFLVIQHGDSLTHATYFPIMKNAVKKGDARAIDLALMEDRTLCFQRKKQIYGTQLNTDTKVPKFYPIKDEPNVNKRRAAMGLEPIEEYAKSWGFVYILPKKNLLN